VILDLRDISSITDFFIILTGGSSPHLRAIADEVTDKVRDEHGIRPRQVDGKSSGNWVVIDYYDVIVHVMSQEMRNRYNLEGLWGDAPRVKPRKPRGMGPVSRNAVTKK
jgi:ribosome-associated protein